VCHFEKKYEKEKDKQEENMNKKVKGRKKK
jgi:hypothetical protein